MAAPSARARACGEKRPRAPATHLVGFVRIEARDIDQAKSFVAGNPIYEAGGTVEVRHLPKDD